MLVNKVGVVFGNDPVMFKLFALFGIKENFQGYSIKKTTIKYLHCDITANFDH